MFDKKKVQVKCSSGRSAAVSNLPPSFFVFNFSDQRLAPHALDHRPFALQVHDEHDEAQREARADHAQFLGRNLSVGLHFRLTVVAAVQAHGGEGSAHRRYCSDPGRFGRR